MLHLLLSACSLRAQHTGAPAHDALRHASMQRAQQDAILAKGDVAFPTLDGSDVRVGIVRARWHADMGDALVGGIKESLANCGVKPENILENEVPGSFELPLASRLLALSGTVDVIIPVGILIKGEPYLAPPTRRFNQPRVTSTHTPTRHPCTPQAIRTTLKPSPTRSRAG